MGRHAEMSRARDNPGNALGQTMRRRSRCVIFREHMRSAPREALDPGQGMSCWAKHCADPAPDRHTAPRRFPKRRTQAVVPPAGRECKFLRGARIPHVGWENTTRRLRGPRKSQLSKAVCKKCPARRQGLVKNPHGGHLSQGKANDSRSGRKMSGLVPRLAENLTRAGRQPSGKVSNSARQPSGKVSSSRRGWKMFGSVSGGGENSTRTPQAFGKNQLCSWAKMVADNLGAGCGRAVPGPAWTFPREGPAPRAAQSAYAL